MFQRTKMKSLSILCVATPRKNTGNPEQWMRLPYFKTWSRTTQHWLSVSVILCTCLCISTVSRSPFCSNGDILRRYLGRTLMLLDYWTRSHQEIGNFPGMPCWRRKGWNQVLATGETCLPKWIHIIWTTTQTKSQKKLELRQDSVNDVEGHAWLVLLCYTYSVKFV